MPSENSKEKSMRFLQCKRYKKDLKEIKKACHEENLDRKICEEIGAILVLRPDFPACCAPLRSFEGFKLFKLRVSACGKGKSGGLRVIFAYEEQENLVILIRVYRKSDRENMTEEEIVENFIHCLENPD